MTAVAKTRLSTKGQVVIPQEIRDSHGWAPGTELEIENRGAEVILRCSDPEPTATWDDLIGCVPYDGPPVSIEEMDQAIAEAIRKRW